LDRALQEVCCREWQGAPRQGIEGQFVNDDGKIGASPFFIEKRPGAKACAFAFDARTTKSNLHKLLRAYQLSKPILIEGPPGVGKTSLVENLARISGRKISRVNLSEQTDMMDLLGSEYPVSQCLEESQGDDI